MLPQGMPPQMGPGRRQNEYQYGYPPQTHPAYYHPHQYYPHPHGPHHPPQWYPHQPYPAYPQQPPVPRFPQYPHVPSPQPHVPMVVSSQPHLLHYPPPPMARPNLSTPPMVHAQIPMQAPPIVTSVPPLPQQSPAPSAKSDSISTPPTAFVASKPSKIAIPSPPATVRGDPEPTAPSKPAFEYPIPWLSRSDLPFPPAAKKRRRRTQQVPSSAPLLELPLRITRASQEEADSAVEAGDTTEEHSESQTSTIAARSDRETPATSQAPSEADEAPTTPSSAAPVALVNDVQSRTPTRPVAPVTPKVPIPPVRRRSLQMPADATKDHSDMLSVATSQAASDSTIVSDTVEAESLASNGETSQAPAPAPAPAVKAPPKSWADLVRSKTSAVATASSGANGVTAEKRAVSKATTIAEALRTYSVSAAEKICFLKPRGLVNAGNMCYMNSVLQTLAFSVPFFSFIDMVSKRAAHSFKSETPLLDAMILFLREYPVIDSAPSVEQLRMRLKKEELEQFGDPFTPQNVYDVIRGLPRFASMKRGAQQDAEEFLIFVLETLHDECVKVINSVSSSAIEASEAVSPTSERSLAADAGWQEVGPKQKASITNTTGHTYNETPITKIFGGTQRSELRVPGKQNSVTFQPFQPLQLDIGAPEVHNIIDALKGSTKPETLHGDFNSPRGPGVNATKQMFIETLPHVLILHLKRFEFNNNGGTQKIWKKIGYPLELTIPKEVFPQQKRGQLALSGLPRYRLEGVIYHHGKNASSGHYTVDLRRQDLQEWIRMDDTIIRRLRAEDIAEGGAEEEPDVLARALDQHKKDSNSKNLFDQFGAVDDDAQSEGGWTTAANAKDAGSKKWSSVANGVATPSSAGAKTPKKENMKDNKVAYILFYRRI